MPTWKITGKSRTHGGEAIIHFLAPDADTATIKADRLFLPYYKGDVDVVKIEKVREAA